MTTTKPERHRAGKEETEAQIHEILSLKAQGWSDAQIRKEMNLPPQMYLRRLKQLRDSDFFKRDALEFLNETVHRLAYLRRRAFQDYLEWKEKKQYNACASAFRRMVEIDTSLPKLCVDLGWSVDDLEKYYRTESKKKDLRAQTEDELYREYRDIIKSHA